MSTFDKSQFSFEEIKLKGNQLVEKIKEVIEEGTARRIIIKKDERTVLEIPLTVGLGGATAALYLHPIISAIGAFIALASDVSVVIERQEADAKDEDGEQGKEHAALEAETE